MNTNVILSMRTRLYVYLKLFKRGETLREICRELHRYFKNEPLRIYVQTLSRQMFPTAFRGRS